MAKRFYKTVLVQKSESGYGVNLDDRILKTPGKQSLVFSHKAHAELVAEEWRAQGIEILPQTMPCTRLVNVACELTPTQRPTLIDEFVSYMANDLLCFRSPAPKDLTAQQGKSWQPVLDWAADKYGLVLKTTKRLTPPKQPRTSLQAARKIAAGLDDKNLTLLLHFTASFGSALLGLAVMEGHIDAATGFGLSQLEENYQNQRWGTDAQAKERTEAILAELCAINLLRDDLRE